MLEYERCSTKRIDYIVREIQMFLEQFLHVFRMFSIYMCMTEKYPRLKQGPLEKNRPKQNSQRRL